MATQTQTTVRDTAKRPMGERLNGHSAHWLFGQSGAKLAIGCYAVGPNGQIAIKAFEISDLVFVSYHYGIAATYTHTYTHTHQKLESKSIHVGTPEIIETRKHPHETIQNDMTCRRRRFGADISARRFSRFGSGNSVAMVPTLSSFFQFLQVLVLPRQRPTTVANPSHSATAMGAFSAARAAAATAKTVFCPQILVYLVDHLIFLPIQGYILEVISK